MKVALISSSGMISETIKRTLSPYGFEITKIDQPEKDLSYIISSHSIYILSDDIDKEDPIKLVEEIISEKVGAKVICIVRKGLWEKRIDLYNAGAEDVIEFPFRTEELVARVRRFSMIDKPTRRKVKVYKIGEKRLDLAQRSFTNGKKSIDLRKKEYGILEYLARNRERVITRSELMDHLWDYRRINSSNTVDVHISKIRKKTKDKDIIKTVHGYGYKINDQCEPDDRYKLD